MKFISWNVNGIRAVIKKDFMILLRIIILTFYVFKKSKANKEQVDLKLDSYPYQYWNSAEKRIFRHIDFF